MIIKIISYLLIYMEDIVEEYYKRQKLCGMGDDQIFQNFCYSGLINYRKILNNKPHKNSIINNFVESFNKVYGQPLYDCPSKEQNHWTSSQKFRDDIRLYFNGFGKNLIIMELGSHLGYTTTILSDIFKHVVAVDINLGLLGVNHERNKNRKNITYLNGDLYGPTFWILDEFKTIKPDIIFLDAVHTYSCVTQDIRNVRNMTNATHIIFDDYSWKSVNHAVNDSIERGHIILEKTFGLSSDQINDLHISKHILMDYVSGVSESVMCRIIRE